MKKRILPVLLSASMVASMAACTKSSDSTETGSGGVSGSGNDAQESSEDTYTYRGMTSMLSTWSPTDAEIITEKYIAGYTCSGLYSLVLNETRDGSEMICEMAADFPEDVTSEYAGDEAYNVPADATEGYAYRVTLRQDAKWEDGTPITAADYEYTLQQYLNPDMKNYVASAWYSGTMTIAHAEDYYNASSSTTSYEDAWEIVKKGEALSDVDEKVYFSLNQEVALFTDYYWLGSYSVMDVKDEKDNADELLKLSDGTMIYDKYEEDKYYEVTDEVLADLVDICENYGYTSDDWRLLCVYEKESDGTYFADAYDQIDSGTAYEDITEDVYFNIDDVAYAFIYSWGESYNYTIKGLNNMEGYGQYLEIADGVSICDKYEEYTDYELTEELYNDLCALSESYYGASDYWTYFCKVKKTQTPVTWDQVGFIVEDDYTITFVLDKQATAFDFESTASSLYLLYEDLYEANKKETGGVIKSSYGTAADKYMSYGPYKVKSYQADKELALTKNENWYGYSDPDFEGQFMTTDIIYSYIEESATQFNLFMQGKLSSVDLTEENLAEYSNSEYCYYDPTGYFYFYVLNSDYDVLKAEEQEGENRTILTYLDFRKAVSRAIDRSEYVASITSTSQPMYGLYNDMYIYDTDTGESYRSLDVAEQALCNVYETDNVDDITGYDKDEAKELFQKAYDEAYADGEINDTDIVTMDFHVYTSETISQKMVNFFEESILDAVEGTSLEGRVKVNLVEDQDYYTSMKEGKADVGYGGWTTTALNPYGDIVAYTSDAYRYDYAFDTSEAYCTVEIDGEEITMNLQEWAEELVDGSYVLADNYTKATILAAMEERILENYTSIPLYTAVYASLYEQRIVMGSDEWVNILVGYGGLRFMTYTMNDAEWEEYCASQNYQLDYN